MTYTLYRLTVSPDLDNGSFTLRYGERLIPDISPSFTLTRKDGISFIRDATVSVRNGYTSKSLIFDTPEAEFSITEQENSPFLEINWEVCTHQTERLSSVTVLPIVISGTYLGKKKDNLRFRFSPFDVWGRPGTRPLSENTSPDDAPRETGYWFGAVYDSAVGDAMTVCHRFPCRFANEVTQEEDLFSVSATVNVPCEPNRPIHSDRMFINVCEPTTTALHRFQSTINNSDRTSGKSEDHVGWNSWDYYKLEVTEKDIIENMDFIRKTPWLRTRIRYIIIDDGWQTLCGDWEPNEKFPDGMDGLAAKIIEAGFIPGMWSAPFFINTNSETYKQHPEWGTQYKGNFFSPYKLIGCEPVWGDRGYLDPTHPQVREHIFNMYRKFHSWGFRYFKTDFMTNAIRYSFGSDFPDLEIDPSKLKYHNMDVPLLEAHRSCMLAIRSAIGEESFWLGCGTHPASAADIVDASRIGGDIHIHYSDILKCAHSSIFNAHYHGRMWLNDPDFAVFRGKDTYKHEKMDKPLEGIKPYDRHEHHSGPPMNAKEAELWATLIIMSGGLVTFSDGLPFIDREAPRIMKTLLEHCGGPASEPLDIASPVPSVLLKRAPKTNMLALFNYEDGGTRTFTVDPDICGFAPETKLNDIWSGEVIDAKGLDHLELAPHTCVLLQYIPEITTNQKS